MDFVYSEEQRMLADSLRRLVQANWTMEKRRARERNASVDAAAWESLAELGVLGLNIDPEHEGFGEDPASLLPVHVELGRGLVPEPVIPSAVMGAAVLKSAGHATHQAALLPAVAQGTTLLALAYQEPNRRYQTRPASTHALAQPDGYRLSGRKKFVWHGAAATDWIVSARTSEGVTGLFVVPANVAGAHVHDMPTLDRMRCAEIVFENVHLERGALLVQGEAAEIVLEDALGWGVAALCAQAAGAMERTIELTVQYLKDRRQFNQPLVSFQALQHRLADMLVAKEMALSMAYVAVAALTETNRKQRSRMISQAKIETARAGRYISEQAIQLHGGMGMTDEMEIGDYCKRLTSLDLLLGDTAEHLRKLEALA
jgi:alkylation response protein AidB-like acyl-CoA dehydrogenase